MNFICDVHLPYRLVNYLKKRGHQATHVNDILDGSNSKDIDIAKYADINNQVILTKDEDFESLHFGKGTPRKLVRILLGNVSTSDLIQIFEKHLPEIEKLKEFERYFISISKNQFTYTTEYLIE
jgi:predicted nuclease of predicted toxin-antitoxin system